MVVLVLKHAAGVLNFVVLVTCGTECLQILCSLLRTPSCTELCLGRGHGRGA